MTRRRRTPLLAVIACAAVLMTGCQPTPGPTPSSSATGFATEAEAFAAAEATYRAYVDALNNVDLSDPATFEPVFALTTGEVSANERKSLSQMHADSWVVSGDSTVSLAEPRSWDAAAQRAEINVCLDVSAVEVKDSSGASMVNPDRANLQSLVVETMSAPSSATGMVVSSILAREGEPAC